MNGPIVAEAAVVAAIDTVEITTMGDGDTAD